MGTRQASVSCQGRVIAGVLLVMVCVITVFEPSHALLHNVGGTGAVWAIGPKLSYNRWAASNVFRVNDILNFQYHAGLHNVVMVSRMEYLQCKVQKPIALFKNGKTRVRLGKKGTYYFICGFPGHCQAGMKMVVTVR